MLRMAVGEMFIHQSPLVAFDEFYTHTNKEQRKMSGFGLETLLNAHLRKTRSRNYWVLSL